MSVHHEADELELAARVDARGTDARGPPTVVAARLHVLEDQVPPGRSLVVGDRDDLPDEGLEVRLPRLDVRERVVEDDPEHELRHVLAEVEREGSGDSGDGPLVRALEEARHAALHVGAGDYVRALLDLGAHLSRLPAFPGTGCIFRSIARRTFRISRLIPWKVAPIGSKAPFLSPTEFCMTVS